MNKLWFIWFHYDTWTYE